MYLLSVTFSDEELLDKLLARADGLRKPDKQGKLAVNELE